MVSAEDFFVVVLAFAFGGEAGGEVVVAGGAERSVKARCRH